MNMVDYLAENEVGLDSAQKEKLQHRLVELEGTKENRIEVNYLMCCFEKSLVLRMGLKALIEKFYASVLFLQINVMNY